MSRLPNSSQEYGEGTHQSSYSGFNEMVKNIFILYTNADSLLNKLEELKSIAYQKKPEIIVITEIMPKSSWSKVGSVEFSIEGYELYTNLDCGLSLRGIAVYILGTCGAVTKLEISLEIRECIFCEIQTKFGESVSILAIYRSPNSTEFDNKSLYKYISKICDIVDKNLIILGDFNFRNINWNNYSISGTSYSKSELEFLELILDNFLTQHINEVTRYRLGQVPSILDLIFSKDENLVTNVEIGPPLGKSDHVSILFELNISTETGNLQMNKRYRYNAGNYQEMRDYIAEIQWEVLLIKQNTLEDNWTTFKTIIEEAVEKFVPKKQEFKNKKPLWINKEVEKILKKKHSAWKKYKMCKTESNFTNFQVIRNFSNETTKQAQQSFELKIANEIKTNPKSFWKYIQSKTKPKIPIGKLKCGKDNLTSNNLEIA